MFKYNHYYELGPITVTFGVIYMNTANPDNIEIAMANCISQADIADRPIVIMRRNASHDTHCAHTTG